MIHKFIVINLFLLSLENDEERQVPVGEWGNPKKLDLLHGTVAYRWEVEELDPRRRMEHACAIQKCVRYSEVGAIFKSAWAIQKCGTIERYYSEAYCAEVNLRQL